MRADLRNNRWGANGGISLNPFLLENGKYNPASTVYVNNVAWVDASANNSSLSAGIFI